MMWCSHLCAVYVGYLSSIAHILCMWQEDEKLGVTKGAAFIWGSSTWPSYFFLTSNVSSIKLVVPVDEPNSATSVMLANDGVFIYGVQDTVDGLPIHHFLLPPKSSAGGRIILHYRNRVEGGGRL